MQSENKQRPKTTQRSHQKLRLHNDCGPIRVVSWSKYCHQTCVVQPVNGN